MENLAQASELQAVPCPGCGLLCDDLAIARDAHGALKVSDKGCAKSIAFFEHPVVSASPSLSGKPADLAAAIGKAVKILDAARHPLIGGLGTDIQGMRAVMNLAEKAGATIDHMNGKSNMRNLFVLQNSGWQITTLSEVRNRVDLLVIVGTDIVSYFPRFFERNIWNQETLFGQDTGKREVVYLGGRNLNTSAGTAPDGRKPEVLPCDLDRLPEVLAALRALASGKTLVASEIAGIPSAALRQLADRLAAAKYGVVAWGASALDIPHAELAIQNITGLVDTLNKRTRCSGLPLSGNDGDVGAYNTSAWISGYPFRMSYRLGQPDYAPHQYQTERLLAEGEADALLWISSFSPQRLAPETTVPRIVIGHPATQFAQPPEVFIPVAVPGIDCAGTQFRSDSSVALPLRQLRASDLPSLSAVLTAIESGIRRAS